MRKQAEVTATALFLQPFTVYVIVLQWLSPPSARNWELADPILKLLPPTPTVWLVPLLAVLALVTWCRLAPPDRPTLVRAARHSAIGFLAALLAVSTLRLVNGPILPAFIPSEENAGPGMLLSMTAGFGEEIIFRLGLLPLVYFGLGRRVLPAVLLTGLGFALLHAAGPEPFNAAYFAVRFFIPGVAMSLVALRVSWPGIAVAHSASHLLLPVLFT